MTDIKCDESLCAVCSHNCSHSHSAETVESKSVSVEEMALRREARAARQAQLLREFSLPIVSFTMNIAGPVKFTDAIETAFNVGVSELKRALARFNVKYAHTEYLIASTGCEALFAVSGINEKLLKAVAVKVEEEYEFSRLYDIDIIGKSGEKLARPKPRKCLVCDKVAFECARNRTHSVEELQKRTRELTRQAISFAAMSAAFAALRAEVETTPKAGLVDMNNNGANSDMTPELFYMSAEALRPYYYLMAYNAADDAPESGHGEGCSVDSSVNCADCMNHESCTLDHGASLMAKLTILGVEAEAKMKEATNGVNTHKGAVFCLGLLVSAYAKLVSHGMEHGPLDIIAEAKRMALTRPDPGRGTHGAYVREKFLGEKTINLGADAEARAGFPAAVNAYRRILGFKLMGFDENPCYALALIGIMAELYDTNAYLRAGAEGADYVRQRASEINAMPLSKRLNEVISFDKELIERNINCGGAADMLAAAIFLDKLNEYNDRLKNSPEEEHHHH